MVGTKALKKRAEKLLADIDAAFERGADDEVAVALIVKAFTEIRLFDGLTE